jgi:hypothetical protein
VERHVALAPHDERNALADEGEDDVDVELVLSKNSIDASARPDVHKPVAEARMRSTPSGTTSDDTAGEKLRKWARGVPAIASAG